MSTSNQCSATTKKGLQCKNKSIDDNNLCVLHIEKELPPVLENLVGTYSEEKEYKFLIEFNPDIHTKEKLIGKELTSLPLNLVFKFKQAYELAINLKKLELDKYYKKNIEKTDLDFLTSVFLELLNVYTNDQLMNTNFLSITFIDYKQNSICILNYIMEKISDQNSVVDSIFSYHDFIPLLSSETQKLINSEKDEDIFDEKIRDAYELMLRGEPSVYSTISLLKYLPIYEKYLIAEFNKQ